MAYRSISFFVRIRRLGGHAKRRAAGSRWSPAMHQEQSGPVQGVHLGGGDHNMVGLASLPGPTRGRSNPMMSQALQRGNGGAEHTHQRGGNGAVTPGAFLHYCLFCCHFSTLSIQCFDLLAQSPRVQSCCRLVLGYYVNQLWHSGLGQLHSTISQYSFRS